MIRDWIKKVSNYIDDKNHTRENSPKAIKPKPSIFGKQSIINSKNTMFFPTGSSNQNGSKMSDSKYAHTDIILTPNQLKNFNYKLYQKLNENIENDDTVENLSNSKDIKFNQEYFVNLFHFFKMPTNHEIDHSFSEFEIDFLKREDQLRIAEYIYQKFRGLIKDGEICHNVFFIESQIKAVTRELEQAKLRGWQGKLFKLENTYKVSIEISESSFDVLMKIRKLRFCLIEIKKSNIYLSKIQQQFKKRDKLKKIVEKLSEFRNKVKPINELIKEGFNLNTVSKNYEALLSSKMFVEKQKTSEHYGVYLIFHKIGKPIDAKIEFLKSRLKQSFILQVRFWKTSKQSFQNETFETCILQMLMIENGVKFIGSLKSAETTSVGGFLTNDKDFFSRTVKELESESGWVDEKVREMISVSHKKVAKKAKI